MNCLHLTIFPSFFSSLQITTLTSKKMTHFWNWRACRRVWSNAVFVKKTIGPLSVHTRILFSPFRRHWIRLKKRKLDLPHLQLPEELRRRAVLLLLLPWEKEETDEEKPWQLAVDLKKDAPCELLTFQRIGDIARIFLSKDKITGQSRGFAFVSYKHREDAEKAIKTLNGYGNDQLILSVEWSERSTMV